MQNLKEISNKVFILGKTKPEAKIFIDDKEVKVSKDGYFAFGLDRDRKNDIVIKSILKGVKEIYQKKSF